MLVDSHCHLHDDAFAGDGGDVIRRAREAGVARIVTVGTSIADSRAAIALAERYDEVYATVGIAPHDEQPFTHESLQQLRELAQHPKVVALGELGLDYHYNTWPHERQVQVFRQQLDLAGELSKPVVIHSRDADADMLETLRAFAGSTATDRAHGTPDSRLLGVMHCFSSTLEMAQACAALGFLISIAGPLTYSKPRALPDVVKTLPLRMLLVETDAPFLAPQSQRGKRNEPARVRDVAHKIAELRGEAFDAVAHATTCNAMRLFWPHEAGGQ